MDTGNNVSDWDERFKTYKANMDAITYPSDGKSFVLYQDKLLDKDATHYGELCTFLGRSQLGTSTWQKDKFLILEYDLLVDLNPLMKLFVADLRCSYCKCIRKCDECQLL